MRTLTKTSLALAAALALGSIATMAQAKEAKSVVLRTAVQTTPAGMLPVDDQMARNKPRVPGGSGCDDPEDLIEHPECRPAIDVKGYQLARSKPRVPGGSGCDDPEDLIEHPECRP